MDDRSRRARSLSARMSRIETVGDLRLAPHEGMNGGPALERERPRVLLETARRHSNWHNRRRTGLEPETGRVMPLGVRTRSDPVDQGTGTEIGRDLGQLSWMILAE